MSFDGQASASLPLILIPDNIVDGLLSGGAELVVEERDSGPVTGRIFLHVFDEFERHETVQRNSSESIRDPLYKVHVGKLRELSWAKSTVWADWRMQEFLPDSDPLLWPSSDRLLKVVEVVKQLKLFADNPPDTRGGDTLFRAVSLIETDTKFSGLHELRKAPVAGKLTSYSVDSWATVTSSAHEMRLPSTMRRRTDPMHSESLHLLIPNNAELLVSAVIDLPQTAHVEKKLTELLALPPNLLSLLASSPVPHGKISKWRELVSLHRRCVAKNEIGLMRSVQDSLRVLQLSEKSLAQMMRGAALSDARVRLRVEVYATVVHFQRLFLVLTSNPKGHLESVEMNALHAFVEKEAEAARTTPFASYPVGMLVVSVPSPKSPDALQSVLTQRFLSPLLKDIPLKDSCSVRQGIQFSDATWMFVVTAPFNPHVVIHGSRVEGGFLGSEEVYQRYKRERDEIAEEQTVMQLCTTFEHSTADAANGRDDKISATDTMTSGLFTSSTLTPEELTAAFERKVLEILAVEPLSRTDLALHRGLSEWRSHSSFDRLLKSCLKKHAVYQGRKYSLRE